MTRPEKVSTMMRSRNGKTGVRINRARAKRDGFHMTWRQIFLIILILFLFMGSSIGYVWSNFEKTQIGYDLSQLKKEEMRQKEINRKLRAELAMLKSTQNLLTLGTQKLGLREPGPEQIIILP